MAADADDDRIELTDLDVITRYSLAVRSATADRGELIAALREDLAWLEGGRSRRRPARPSGAVAAKKTTTPAGSRSARGR
jgi:hypothetical protein